MASAAEQLAANLNFGALGKATELKKRLWFTLIALVIYRLGTYIPIPGVDPSALESVFSQNSGGILGMFNMLAGGALARMTIFALNIMPYISASIIMQLLSTVSPQLEQMKKEGEAGRKKINQYTRYGTVVLAALQAYGIAVGLEGMSAQGGGAVINPGLFFRFSTVVTLTGGTVFLMWLGEQITARGVGNGISLIIFSGIVAQLPSAMAGTLELGRTGALSTFFILFVIVMVVAVVVVGVRIRQGNRGRRPGVPLGVRARARHLCRGAGDRARCRRWQYPTRRPLQCGPGTAEGSSALHPDNRASADGSTTAGAGAPHRRARWAVDPQGPARDELPGE